MPRPLRHFHPGGIYHITHRGHNKFHIFEETIDKAHFLDILRKVVQETGCHVLYYTIMDNHYHLLIEMQEIPLDKVMHKINSRFAHYYTSKINLSGAVFGNRYFSQEILNQKYLCSAIQYIAVNPIKAGLVQKIPEYRWSAHSEIANRKQEIITSQRLFNRLGDSIEQGKANYVTLINEAQKNVEKAANFDVSPSGRRLNALEDQLITFLASSDKNPTFSQIRSSSRSQKVLETRRTFAKLANAQGYPICDIARVLHVSTRSVYTWCKDVTAPQDSYSSES